VNYPNKKSPEGAFLQGFCLVYFSANLFDFAGLYVYKVFCQCSTIPQRLGIKLFILDVFLHKNVNISEHIGELGGRSTIIVDDKMNLTIVAEALLIILHRVLGHVDALRNRGKAPVSGNVVWDIAHDEGDPIDDVGLRLGTAFSD